VDRNLKKRVTISSCAAHKGIVMGISPLNVLPTYSKET
jgi:hypothetical protein